MWPRGPTHNPVHPEPSPLFPGRRLSNLIFPDPFHWRRVSSYSFLLPSQHQGSQKQRDLSEIPSICLVDHHSLDIVSSTGESLFVMHVISVCGMLIGWSINWRFHTQQHTRSLGHTNRCHSKDICRSSAPPCAPLFQWHPSVKSIHRTRTSTRAAAAADEEILSHHHSSEEWQLIVHQRTN